MPPRTKRQVKEPTPRQSKSAARREQDLPPKQTMPAGARKGMVPKPPTVFTDIPSVVKVLDEASGHYQYKIDEDALYALSSTHASFDQLAVILKVPEHVLTAEPYRTIIEEARAMALVGLRSSQFKAAVEDRNPTMQIWLGKQYLNQKDLVQNQQLGADGRPIDAFRGPTFVAVMPPNGRDLAPSRQITASAVIDGVPIVDGSAPPGSEPQKESAA